MASHEHCDWDGCDQPYTWLVSNQDIAETLAWCDEHMGIFCRTFVAQQEEVAATVAQAAAEAAPAGPDDPDEDNEDAPAVERLRQEATGRPRTPETVQGVVDMPPDQVQAAEAAVRDLAPATVVRRGASKGRRAHEARKREKARAGQEETE